MVDEVLAWACEVARPDVIATGVTMPGGKSETMYGGLKTTASGDAGYSMAPPRGRANLPSVVNKVARAVLAVSTQTSARSPARTFAYDQRLASANAQHVVSRHPSDASDAHVARRLHC